MKDGTPAHDGRERPPAGRGPGANAPKRRVFFALWLDAACRARLTEAAAPILEDLPGRTVLPLDWHVTLCFLGAVDAALLAPLQSAAGQIGARGFALAFDRVGYWREARVIAATGAAVPAAAQELAAALREVARSMGLTPDEKPLRPHVTLVRGVSPALWQRAGAGLDPRADRAVAMNLNLAASEFHLAESLGAAQNIRAADPAGPASPAELAHTRRYAILARWPL